MGAVFSQYVPFSKTHGLGFAACLGVGAVFVALTACSRRKTVTSLMTTSFKVAADQAEGTYDTWAANYEKESQEMGFASPWACAEATMAVVKNGARLLDIGCGTGWVGKLCLDLGMKGSTMDGSDLSQEMLKVLQTKGRTNIYKALKKHDIAVVPWPFETKAYDCTLCNGVLIYVEKPAVLDEFVRVTKKGGHCLIMFRDDGYPVYEAYDKKMRADGKWEFISQTEPVQNFPKAPMSSPSSKIMFSIYTYQVLV